MGNTAANQQAEAKSSSEGDQDVADIQEIIKFAILSDPHNSIEYKDIELDDDTKILARAEIDSLKANNGIGNNISLWRKVIIDEKPSESTSKKTMKTSPSYETSKKRRQNL
jgi:hypothetical protein